MKSFSRWFSAVLAGFFAVGIAVAQDASSQSPSTSQPSSTSKSKTASSATGQETDPLKRPLSEKEKKEREKAFKKEAEGPYKKWLNEDVAWIITDEERSAFKQLSNNEERDQFIEQFWLRRDPTPDTVENEFKEEHYRRIAYANEHFASGIPGWKTDRGRIYIIFGPPDNIESHAGGGAYTRPMEEGGGQTSTYPFEIWNYRYIEGIGQNIDIEFVDPTMTGEYHMTMDRTEKDALLHVPNAGLTLYEELGLVSKTQRFTNNGVEALGSGPLSNMQGAKTFDRLEQFAKLNRPPQVKFKDLEEVVTHKISVNLMPFAVRTDFVRVTGDTVLVPVTVQVKNKDITFVNKDGIQRGLVNIFGRVTTLTGRIAQTFEDTVKVDVPADLLSKTMENSSVYWKSLPLRPNRYRLDIVVKDVNGDRVGTWSRGIMVPDYGEDKLAYSSLIIADQMEPVPTRNVGAGNFVIGSTKVRPRVEGADGKPATFKRQAGQKVNFWMQVYNLGVDEQKKRPSATIEYDVVNDSTKKDVVKQVENTEQMGNIGDQLTLQKSLPLEKLEPGLYTITIKVNDNISKQTVSPTARFVVE